MREFRVFLSSPGDAANERRRADTIVSRLNGEFAGLARLVAIRWETEHYKAHETFQPQIPAAESCDVVVGILRWRLGTPLPPTFPDRLPGDEAYPSGTAYEILTSIDKRHRGAELPDVYVFRYAGGAPLIAIGDPEEDAKRAAWTALRGFISRWFETPAGTFAAAFNSYGSEDDFEHQLETLLRKWLADKVAGGRVVPWPATKRSPFRGLGVFGARHAPVFFGRAADIRKAMDIWRDAAARGERSLLVIGASGAGKSSLARAGLIPRLTTPGVIPEVDRWRIAALRPGDSPAGPFASLADALLRTEADLPEEERGRGDALPEIAAGDFETPAALAAILAHADGSAARVVVRALDRIADGLRTAERFERPVRCDLVLLVDQLDELFAPSVAPETRDAFARLLAALVDSRRIWVITTLRADLYEPMLKVAALKALKDRGASYDLAPPGAAELAEIVREPAHAAALTFETDVASGERLDERLLREADRPDMLPLVQLALSRLWEARVTRGSETILPLAAFEAQGGVKGIVAEAGESALAGLGEAEQGRLAPLIRRLAELSRGADGGAGLLGVRAVPLAEAAPDDASRRLVDALVAARLLTLSATSSSRDEGPASDATLRLTHQRVLADWPRAATIVAESADFYRVRDEVEEQRRRWEGSGKRGDRLLARGLPLAEAGAMVEKYGPELSASTRAYVAASRRRATRAQALAWGAAAVFALVAVMAGFAAKLAVDRQAEADRQRQIAERDFDAAKTTVDGLIFDIAQGLRNVSGMRNDTIRTILDTVRKTVDRLIETSPGDVGLLRSRSAMLTNFVDTYLAAGDLEDARTAADEKLAIARTLAARDPGNTRLQDDLAISFERIGDVRSASGDRAGALVAYEQMLAIYRKLAAQRGILVSLEHIGDMKQLAGDQAGALSAFQDMLGVDRQLAAQAPGSASAQRDLSVGLGRIGNMKLQAGDRAGALAAYQQALEIDRKLAARFPGDAQAQRDVSINLNRIGDVKLLDGDRAGALGAYQPAFDIARTLASQDPGNAIAQGDVSASLERIGVLKLRAGDRAGALAAFAQDLEIEKTLAARDPGNVQAQRNVSVGLNNLGDIKLQAGDDAGALAAFEQGLAIARTLAAKDAQHDVLIGLENIGDAKLQAPDQAGALAAYEQALEVARKLLAQDPDSAQALGDVSSGLEKIDRIADLRRQADDPTGALAAYQRELDSSRDIARTNPGNARVQRSVLSSLDGIGDVKQQSGDHVGAIAAYQEGLAVARALAAREPENPVAQHDLFSSLTDIALAKLDGAERDAALAYFNEALPIAARLAAQNGVGAQSDLEWVRKEIQTLAR